MVKMKGWDTNVMTIQFRFKKKKRNFDCVLKTTLAHRDPTDKNRCEADACNIKESLKSDEKARSDLKGPVEGTAGDDDRSQVSFSLTLVQPSLSTGLHRTPQDVADFLVLGRSRQDKLTSGLLAVEFLCCHWVILFFGSVSQTARLWTITISVSDTGTVTDVSNNQLESCGDITGETRCPCYICELEQIKDPVNTSKMEKWIEHHQN